MQRITPPDCQPKKDTVRPLLLCLLSLLLLAGACTKRVQLPNLSGQWKWVALDWEFGPGSGIIYPGKDSTVLIRFNPSTLTYLVEVNGQTTLTASYGPAIATPVMNTDSSVDILNPRNYSFADGWVISGDQQVSIRNDTLSLFQQELNPAGIASKFKFIPWP